MPIAVIVVETESFDPAELHDIAMLGVRAVEEYLDHAVGRDFYNVTLMEGR